MVEVANIDQKLSSAYRLGQGYDIHRLVVGKALMIGGVRVESERGSEAHSDGDALLHALIDALLGACALGDIGDHFPPSDPQYKDIDSAELLRRALPLIAQAGYAVGNVDATVFLEKPKLYPSKQAIRDNLAALLQLSPEAVSFKAKTAEGFPPVGTQDAIAASVSVLLVKV